MTTNSASTSSALPALLAGVVDDLAVLLDGIGDAELDRPTPCTDFDVAALRNHVLSWLTSFAAGAESPDGAVPDVSAYEPTGDPGAKARRAGEGFAAGLAAGAAERPLSIGGSAMPGELAFGMILWEYQMHGWDLAVATGRPWSPPAAAVEHSLAFAPGMLSDDYQGEGKAFAPRVPVSDDAPALERLLGLSGRDPAWRAPTA